MVPPSEFHFFFALHGKIKYYRHELHDFFSMHNAHCIIHNHFFTTNFTNFTNYLVAIGKPLKPERRLSKVYQNSQRMIGDLCIIDGL